jgi:hypothetical protein
MVDNGSVLPNLALFKRRAQQRRGIGIMAKHYFLPRRDGDRRLWLNQFSHALDQHGLTLGLSAGDIAGVQKDAAMFSWVVEVVELFKTNTAGRFTFKQILCDGSKGQLLGEMPAIPVLPAPPPAVRAGIFPRLKKLVQRIKNHPNYTAAIGQQLGNVGAEHVIDWPGLKPQLKVVLSTGQPLIIWTKGATDGLEIWVDRNDGKGSVYLARNSDPDYLDRSALPAPDQSAVWVYKAIYLSGDQRVGQWSDLASVAVSGG